MFKAKRKTISKNIVESNWRRYLTSTCALGTVTHPCSCTPTQTLHIHSHTEQDSNKSEILFLKTLGTENRFSCQHLKLRRPRKDSPWRKWELPFFLCVVWVLCLEGSHLPAYPHLGDVRVAYQSTSSSNHSLIWQVW